MQGRLIFQVDARASVRSTEDLNRLLNSATFPDVFVQETVFEADRVTFPSYFTHLEEDLQHALMRAIGAQLRRASVQTRKE